jgi:ankyrin repeat protein
MIDNGIHFLEMSDQSLKKEVIGRSHYRLLMSCLRYVRIGAAEGQRETLKDSSTSYNGEVYSFARSPFAEYASSCCGHHMRAADAQGVSLSDVIRFTQWPSNAIWVKRHEAWLESLGASDMEYQAHQKTLQHFAAETGLHSLMEAIIPLCKEPSLLATISASMGIMNVYGIESINASDWLGDSPLLLAARSGHKNIVKLLLSKKSVLVDLKNRLNQTALMCASSKGHLQVVELLLAANVDINASCVAGTALQQAAEGGHFKVVELLLAANADVNVPACMCAFGELRTLQEAAVYHLDRIAVPIVHFMAKGTISAASPSRRGRTALIAAAAKGHIQIVERLLIANADVNAVAAQLIQSDRGTDTALHSAVRGNHHGVVKTLLDNGADVHMTDGDLTTALHLAVSCGHPEIVKLLVSAGSNLSARDKDNRTPLQVAARLSLRRCEPSGYRWSKIIKYLRQEASVEG